MSEQLKQDSGQPNKGAKRWENMDVESEKEEHPQARDVSNETLIVGNLDNAKPVLDNLAQKYGQLVSMDFNGHTIRSDMSIDEMYLEVLGRTKEEYDKLIEESHQKQQEEESRARIEAEAKMPERIEAGKAFIYTEKQQDWENCVKARSEDLYYGADIDDALEAMSLLDQGASFEDVEKNLIDGGQSGASFGMIRNIIFSFSKRGPEFYQASREAEGRPLTKEELRSVAKQKLENAQMELRDLDSN